MSNPEKIRDTLLETARIIIRNWRIVSGIAFAGFLGGAVTVSPSLSKDNLVAGGIALGLVAGVAATGEKFRGFAAGAPFLVFGLFAGAGIFGPFSARFTFWSLVGAFVSICAGMLIGAVASIDEGKRDA